MEWTTDKIRWSEDSSGCWVSIWHPNQEEAKRFVSSIEKPQKIVIKQYRKAKSLDANAYCWVLLNKLSAVLGRSDVDIYRELVPCIGENSHIMPVRDDLIDEWIQIWEREPDTKKGWVSKVLGKCKNTEGYSNTINYYGSSMYDSAQMSRLIDLVIQECEQQGIETRTPAEIERLKMEWGDRK